MSMKIYFAGDHAGFEMKKELMEFVRSLGHEVEDMGPFSYDAGDDYPDYVLPMARRVAETSPTSLRSAPSSRRELIYSPLEGSTQHFSEKCWGRDVEVRGIIIGGSGQGEAMCANRFNGVRAAVYYGGDVEVVKKSREHNNANILSLGARFVSEEDAKTAVKFFLETQFSGEERHIRRIQKLDQ